MKLLANKRHALCQFGRRGVKTGPQQFDVSFLILPSDKSLVHIAQTELK